MKTISLLLILYTLLFFLRLQQPAFEPQWDFFKEQRHFLGQKIASNLPSPEAEILSGILLGQNNTLPPHIKLALRDSSTLHIVVASGQNLSMVAGFFLYLSGLIKRKNAIILGILVAFLYTLLTGLQVPILRAFLMFSLASLGKLLGRDSDGIWILSVTGALMLLINPQWVTSISFQLSFLATLGVVAVAPVFLRRLKSLPEFIAGDLSVTLAAQLMVLPIIAVNFHQISLVGLFANLLVLWTIPFIMIGGVILLILPIFSFVLSSLLTYFIYIVEFFAGLPFAWQYFGEISIIFWLGYYLIILAIMLSLKYVQKTT